MTKKPIKNGVDSETKPKEQPNKERNTAETQSERFAKDGVAFWPTKRGWRSMKEGAKRPQSLKEADVPEEAKEFYANRQKQEAKAKQQLPELLKEKDVIGLHKKILDFKRRWKDTAGLSEETQEFLKLLDKAIDDPKKSEETILQKLSEAEDDARKDAYLGKVKALLSQETETYNRFVKIYVGFEISETRKVERETAKLKEKLLLEKKEQHKYDIARAQEHIAEDNKYIEEHKKEADWYTRSKTWADSVRFWEKELINYQNPEVNSWELREIDTDASDFKLTLSGLEHDISTLSEASQEAIYKNGHYYFRDKKGKEWYLKDGWELNFSERTRNAQSEIEKMQAVIEEYKKG